MQEADIPARLVPVLRLVAEGKRNKAIADDLSLAEHTVENYVSELIDGRSWRWQLGQDSSGKPVAIAGG